MKKQTFTLPFNKFIEYTGLTYNNDLYDSQHINYESQDFSITDMIQHLPNKCTITESVLDNLPELKLELNTAINLAYEDSLLCECYSAQIKAFENIGDDVVQYINHIIDGAINYIKVDFKKEVVYINVNPAKTLKAILEIINGEGLFSYESVNELMITHSTRKSAIKTIEQTMHYLLNLNLINRIYGFSDRPNVDWEINDWKMQDEAVLNQLSEMFEHSNKLLYGKISVNTYSAIITTQKLVGMKAEAKHLKKVLKKFVKAIPINEGKYFKKQTKDY